MQLDTHGGERSLPSQQHVSGPSMQSIQPNAPIPESRVPRQPSQRANVSSACKACKARRSKCTGEHPCPRCIQARTQCEYEPQNDGRRKETVKRKFEDLAKDSELLQALLRAFKFGHQKDVHVLLGRIRSEDLTIDEIAALVDGMSLESEAVDGALPAITLDDLLAADGMQDPDLEAHPEGGEGSNPWDEWINLETLSPDDELPPAPDDFPR